MSNIIKTPTVIQMEAVECGAASLGMVLGYHGCFVPLEELRVSCGVSRDGSNAANVSKAAKSYGCESKIGFFTPESLKKANLPAIIFWNHNHFMVYEGYQDGFFYVNDPKSGRRKVDEATFQKSFSQVAIQINPGEKFKKRKKEGSVLKEFYDKIKGDGKALLFIVLVTLLLTFPTLATPVFSQIYIDNYLTRGQVDWLKPLLAIMIGLLIIQFCFVYFQRSILKRLETKMSLNYNRSLVHHMLSLPMSFYAQRQTGDLITRLQSNDNIAKILSGPLGITLISLIQALFYLVLMFCYSITLGFIVLFLSAINIWSYYLVKEKRCDWSLETKQANAKLTSTTMGGLSMMESLKASGTENDLFAKWQNHLINYINAYQRLSYMNTLLTGLPVFLTTLANALILGVGAWLAINGNLSVGGVVAFQALFLVFNEPIKQFVDVGGQIQQVEADFKRVADVFHYQSNEVNKKNNNNDLLNTHNFQGKVEIKNITFRYSPLEKALFDNFSLTIEAGQRVAFVGLSASGKSTLGKLICGLYQPEKGDILIDGISVYSLSNQQRANLISMVSQDQFFFKGTIAENLSLWGGCYKEQELIDATETACIYDLILKNIKGFDGLLDEGASNISGGQRQRLEIARTLLMKPKVLILDEATSALDSLVEQQVDKNLRQQMMTTISIAHRLSTIRDADAIYVFENGKTIANGTHDELINDKCELYLELIGKKDG